MTLLLVIVRIWFSQIYCFDKNFGENYSEWKFILFKRREKYHSSFRTIIIFIYLMCARPDCAAARWLRFWVIDVKPYSRSSSLSTRSDHVFERLFLGARFKNVKIAKDVKKTIFRQKIDKCLRLTFKDCEFETFKIHILVHLIL